MAINGLIGTFTYASGRVRGSGHAPVIASGLLAAAQGSLPMGLLLAENAAGALIPWAQVSGEAIGVGGAAAVGVQAEVLGAGDGAITHFGGLLANPVVAPGTVTINATVGGNPAVIADNGLGVLSGAGVGGGFIDYANGVYSVDFAVAPDNATNVTADYEHTAPAVTFTATLASFPVRPGSVVVTDGVEAFADDGNGVLTGDAGGTGTVNYETGDISVTFAVAPLPLADVDATYDLKLVGVLDDAVDTAVDNVGLYIPHGSVVESLLKVGVLAQTAPDAATLAVLQDMGIYPE